MMGLEQPREEPCFIAKVIIRESVRSADSEAE